MKTLLLWPLLLVFVFPVHDPTTPQEGSSVTVVSFKWSKTRQNVTASNPSTTGPGTPAPAMITENKNLQRNARVNDPAGVRDPNADTADGRSAAIDKMTQESRTGKGTAVDGFAYLVNVQNTSKKVIDILFWEYQFIDPSNPANLTRRQFLCGVSIKSDKQKELRAFDASGPGAAAVTAAGAANPPGAGFQEKVVINRVEYADGSSWTRKDWNAAEIKLSYQRAMATPWNPGEMCRGL
jgi:hypothetical protein